MEAGNELTNTTGRQQKAVNGINYSLAFITKP